MRHRSNIINAAYFETGVDKRPQSSLASRSRTFNLDFDLSHTLVGSFFGGIGHGVLSCKRGAFSRSLKAEDAGTAPGYDITLLIGDGYDGIIEGGIDTDYSFRYILFDLLLYSCLGTFAFCHSNT